MPEIIIETHIKAPIERCFNLARSIDLHLETTQHTGEQAIAGKTSGLIGLNETVTWKAKHLSVWQQLTSKITEYQYPVLFVDEMTKGTFRSLRHEHRFSKTEDGTLMKDVFRFESPFGLLGAIFNKLFLTNYLHQFILERNEIIKQYAETDKGDKFLI